MKRLKIGTPLAGIIFGSILAAAGVLVMVIGFWRALLLVALFAAGYFFGAVDHKDQVIKGAIRKIIPEKDDKPINIKEEIYREQAQSAQRMVFSFEEDPESEQSKE